MAEVPEKPCRQLYLHVQTGTHVTAALGHNIGSKTAPPNQHMAAAGLTCGSYYKVECGVGSASEGDNVVDAEMAEGRNEGHCACQGSAKDDCPDPAEQHSDASQSFSVLQTPRDHKGCHGCICLCPTA